MWCLPTIDETFISRMETLLDLYAEPHDPERPVVCIDEKPVQLIGDARPGCLARPGRPKRTDYQYRRLGTRNLFVCFEPQAGWRQVTVTRHRKTADFAEQLRFLAEEKYPDATAIRVVCDNLNTHHTDSLYLTFPVEQARRIADKIEWYYTPTHASWPDLVEIELSVLGRQCLPGRIPYSDKKEDEAAQEAAALLEERTAAWSRSRNDEKATVDWQFTTEKARETFGRHYPTLSS